MINLPSRLRLLVSPAFALKLAGIGMVLALGMSQSAWANTARQDLSQVQVMPHELALTQVLNEICPNMLTPAQRRKFSRAYQAQLQEFLPNLNTQQAMQQIGSQKEYQRILGSMRTWTMSFPKEENKALCIEFAESQSVASF